MRNPMNQHISRSCVLLVEDVSAMRLYLRLALERCGAEVLEAANLTEARRILRAGVRPTSVLLDLELPDGNGLDLLGELPPGVPVAALTADDSRETALRCREAGCNAVLCKTEKLADLAPLIGKMERSRQVAPLKPDMDPGLVAQYVNYLAEARLELQRAGQCRDFDAVRRIAHRLRGTAVHFGYAGIGAGARAVGSALASGSTEQIAVALETLVERLLDAVESHHVVSAQAAAGAR